MCHLKPRCETPAIGVLLWETLWWRENGLRSALSLSKWLGPLTKPPLVSQCSQEKGARMSNFKVKIKIRGDTCVGAQTQPPWGHQHCSRGQCTQLTAVLVHVTTLALRLLLLPFRLQLHSYYDLASFFPYCSVLDWECTLSLLHELGWYVCYLVSAHTPLGEKSAANHHTA